MQQITLLGYRLVAVSDSVKSADGFIIGYRSMIRTAIFIK